MPKAFEKPIYVTRPALPSLDAFKAGLEGIWDRAWLTNKGPVLQQFQERLVKYCDTKNLNLFSNGTLALQIALQGMRISGDVITTPFTFVATPHVLFWNRLRPVFVDIEPKYCTLDPEQVEAAITPWTSAILAVHVYGYPCHLAELDRIARKHGLKLLYDAAHAFGVTVDGIPIGNFGDLSMFSFHATKIFHSLEGGMLTYRDPSLSKLFEYLKNFGFESEVEVVMPGTNAKMNEIQALMGLLLLDRMSDLIETRRLVSETYNRCLNGVPGLALPPAPQPGVSYNYAYFPVQIDAKEFGQTRDSLYSRLKEWNVHARRYFYPLVTDFSCYRGMVDSRDLPVAKEVASKIITLPIYSDLDTTSVENICDIIRHIQANPSPSSPVLR